MKLRDRLSPDIKKKLKDKTRHKKQRKKKKEKLTFGDVMSLMGANRDTYRRGKGGALRRR